MSKFQNGQIYKIVDVGYNKCYIGSTCEELSQRMARHRSHYKSYLKGQHGHTKSFDIFNEYGIDNCKIEWVENYPCNSKKELEAREGIHIKNNTCVNKNVAGRTDKEYREDNKEAIRQSYNNWKENNKEKYQTYQKQWQNDNKEHLQDYKHNWYENDKERIKARISEWAKQSYNCECGSSLSRGNLSIHLKTKRHQDYIN